MHLPGTPADAATELAAAAAEAGIPSGAAPSPEPAGTDQPYPPATQGWYCVIVLALAVMVNFLDRGILNLLVEPIKKDLQLTDMQMSLVMGFAFTFFYAIFGLPVARWIDRGTRKAIFSGGLFIFSIMTVFAGMATNFWQLFAARVGLGVGETTSGPSAYSLMSDYFPPHRLPRAISVMQVGFVLGNGLAFILGAWIIGFVMANPEFQLPFLGELRGWQIVLMLVSIPGFIVAALMLTVREPPRRGAVVKAPLGDVFRLVAQHKLIYLTLFIGMGLRSAQMFGQQNWAASFYIRTYGWTPAEVGYAIGLSLFVSMPLGLILGNWLAEYYQRKGVADGNIRVVVLSTLVSVPFGIAFPLMPTPWLAVACSLVAGMTSIMAAAPENAAIQSVTPNRLRGQMTFLFLFIMNVIGMGLGPVIVGALSQYVYGEENIRYAIVTMGVLMGIPAIFVFWRGMAAYGRAYAAGGVEVR